VGVYDRDGAGMCDRDGGLPGTDHDVAESAQLSRAHYAD
jgi:hypothetical protein